MTTLTDDAHLRLAVLEHPHDDDPRLQLADCLDDSGEPDKAAFIRLQVELARLGEKAGHRDDYLAESCKCEWCVLAKPLRRREREWFVASGYRQFLSDPFTAVECGDNNGTIGHTHPVGREPCIGIVRRGFVESVTCPTTLFIGGVCERCGGDGRAHGADRPFQWSPHVDYGKCVVCKGSGRTVGIAGPLFAREPVLSVTLDREPAGHSKTWWWFFPASVGLVANAGNHLPDILIPFFDKGCFGGHIYYDSRDLALAALSSAAVALGRAAATDCTHEVECETCERTGKVKPYPVRYRTSLFRGARRQTDLCPACDGTGRVVRAGLPPLVNHKATSEAP